MTRGESIVLFRKKSLILSHFFAFSGYIWRGLGLRGGGGGGEGAGRRLFWNTDNELERCAGTEDALGLCRAVTSKPGFIPASALSHLLFPYFRCHLFNWCVRVHKHDLTLTKSTCEPVWPSGRALGW